MMDYLFRCWFLWLLFRLFSCNPACAQGGVTTVEFPHAIYASYSIVTRDRAVPFTSWDRVNGNEPKSRRIVGSIAFPSDLGIRVRIRTVDPMQVEDALAHIRLFGADRVTELEIDGEGSASVLTELKFHQRLRFLAVRGCKDLDTPPGIAALSKLTALEYLAISPFAEASSVDFAQAVASLSRLKCVRLCADGVGEDFVEILCKLKGLETVEFFGNRPRIASNALRHFRSLAKLSQLSVFCDPDIRMSDLEALAKHPPMRRLWISTNSTNFDHMITEQQLNQLVENCDTRVEPFIVAAGVRDAERGMPPKRIADGDPGAKSAVFPNSTSRGLQFGKLMVESKLPLTENDFHRLRVRLGGEIPELSLAPLQGTVSWSEGEKIFVSFEGKSPEEMLTVLELLRRFSDNDVSHLRCIGPIKPAVLAEIRRHRGLRSLYTVASAELEADDSMNELRQFSGLEVLKISRSANMGGITSVGFAKAAAEMRSLRALSISCDRLTDEFVKALASRDTLEFVELSCRGSRLSGRALVDLAKLPKLRHLRIACNENVTDADLVGFFKLKDLEVLTISTDAALTSLEALRKQLPEATIVVLKSINDSDIP